VQQTVNITNERIKSNGSRDEVGPYFILIHFFLVTYEADNHRIYINETPEKQPEPPGDEYTWFVVRYAEQCDTG
jgi:hypothetical protein